MERPYRRVAAASCFLAALALVALAADGAETAAVNPALMKKSNTAKKAS
jgi:hypothetical protein